jgi:hypothetical protein
VTTLKRISLLLALGACLAAAGCGGDKEKGRPIPRAQAAELERRLSEAENRLANGSAGACRDILIDTRPAVQATLKTLPRTVDADVRSALEQSFQNLWNLVDSECQNLTPDQPTQTNTTTQPETTPTDTATTPTTDTAPPSTDTTTAPDQAPLPNDGNGDNGGAIPPTGNGGGVGPGAAKENKVKEK